MLANKVWRTPVGVKPLGGGGGLLGVAGADGALTDGATGGTAGVLKAGPGLVGLGMTGAKPGGGTGANPGGGTGLIVVELSGNAIGRRAC